jgi:O-antigen ligase
MFIVWSGFSIFWADSWRSVAHHTLVWTNYLLFFIFSFFYLKTIKSIQPLYIIFSITALLLGIFCLMDYLFVVVSGEPFSILGGAIRIRYAKFAELLLIAAPLLWALALYTKSLRKSLFFTVAGSFAWLTILFSLSKGAFLAGIVAFAFLFLATFFFSKRGFRRRSLLLGAIWLLITISTQINFSTDANVPSTANYIQGSAEKGRETSVMRIFTWKAAGQMISDNWLLGVGADNFGIKVNQSVGDYFEKHPQDKTQYSAEHFMIERAHNEFLQVFAELGIVGFTIFAGIFISFAIWIIKSFILNHCRFSPIIWGGLAGMTAFFVSSMVSSFSFRAAQNGIVFFLVLAIVSLELLKISKKSEKIPEEKEPRLINFKKPLLAFGLSAATLSIILFSTQAASQYAVFLAEKAGKPTVAEKYLETAIMLDNDNAAAYFIKGSKFCAENQPAEGISFYQKAIEKGIGISFAYSKLADCQADSGDYVSAEKTLAEAVRVHPHSVFVQIRYALVLGQNGKINESNKYLEIARNLDKKQANGWYALISKGSLEAFNQAKNDAEIAGPADLLPANAVPQYIKFPKPDDKAKIADNR